jgi:hypothetical protein
VDRKQIFLALKQAVNISRFSIFGGFRRLILECSDVSEGRTTSISVVTDSWTPKWLGRKECIGYVGKVGGDLDSQNKEEGGG